jgi:hypothetical protein
MLDLIYIVTIVSLQLAYSAELISRKLTALLFFAAIIAYLLVSPAITVISQ